MADAICRWRNGTPKTVVELVNSLPHEIMTIDAFRASMVDKWDGDFFRTAYQLACQLALYCEADDGYYYPRFYHDINESEAEEYLLHWFPRYYVPNPYTRKDGFQNIPCPTYFLKSLYNYTIDNPNCSYKDAYEACFHESAKNNDDIIKNYINKYSHVLTFSKDGTLNITSVNPLTVFPDMDRNNKKEFFDSFNENQKSIQREYSLQQIYYGAPGTGKSHIINKKVCGESVIRTTFHPDSDYSTFVGCYKPTTKTVKMRDMAGHVIKENGEEVTEDRIVYEFVDQAFLQAYIKAWKFYATQNEEIKNQFLVIEEINRGNCAQIFGDLFQLLDRNGFGFSDYPIQADNDMRKQLAKAFKDIKLSEENKNRINACYNGNKDYVSQVLDGEILLLPDNLYIWATMNTSDQSLFPIDSAFKRRWDWQYMPIAKGREEGKELNWSIEADTNLYDWWSFLTKINEQIGSTTNSEDKKLGFFFCKAKNGVISAETFVGKVIFYLWNDVFKDFGFENTIFNDEDGSTLSFDKFYSTNAEGKVVVNKNKVQRFLDNLGVEVASVVELDEEDEEEDEENVGSDLTITFTDGTTITGKTRFDSYINAIIKIGIDNIIPIIPNLKYKRLGCPVISLEQYEKIENNTQRYSYVEVDGCYFVKGMNGRTMKKILLAISEMLNLNLIIEYK